MLTTMAQSPASYISQSYTEVCIKLATNTAEHRKPQVPPCVHGDLLQLGSAKWVGSSTTKVQGNEQGGWDLWFSDKIQKDLVMACHIQNYSTSRKS